MLQTCSDCYQAVAGAALIPYHHRVFASKSRATEQLLEVF